MQNPNCFECEYKGRVAGSAHIQCKHPSLKKALDNPMLQLLSVLATGKRVTPFIIASNALNIKADEAGIKGGWFNFPFNFDPTWLENCDGFKPKEVKT